MMIEDSTVISGCSPSAEVRSRPLYLEVDFVSEQGGEFLRAAVARHGPYIESIASLASPVFLLRSPWAPGLRFVGAQARSADGEEQVYSVSGAGERLHDAFASCMGEAVERLAPIERRGDVLRHAGLREVHDRVLPSAVPLIIEALAAQALSTDHPLRWIEGRVVAPEMEAEFGRDVLLPADWCLRIPDGRVCLRPRTALSVGVAAGPDHDWAASRALMELVERDAAGLWWVGGRRGRALALDRPNMAAIADLLARLRQEVSDRRTWLLDITTDIGIPTVAALSCSPDGRKLAYGLATRLSLADGARAAILELCQTELAILLAETKLRDAGEASLTPLDRAHLSRCADLDVADCEHLHPADGPVAYARTPHRSALLQVLDALGRAGIEAALVDLTRPEFGARVIRAVAPALQPMPSVVVTDRLRRTLNDWGGGPRRTTGFDLL